MYGSTDYRIALLLPSSHQLLGRKVGNVIDLPILPVPDTLRPAQYVLSAIKQRWHIEAILIDIVPSSDSRMPCAILEIRGNTVDWDSVPLTPVDYGHVGGVPLTPEELRALAAILHPTHPTSQGISTVGWVDSARSWIQQLVASRGLTLKREVEQINGGGGFALIRFSSSEGPAFWLKAAGFPNQHEFPITLFLSKRFPTYVPNLIGSYTNWNAWVTDEFGSAFDHKPLARAACLSAAVCLAELQLASIDHKEGLLRACCGDQRLAVLRGRTDDLIGYLCEAMKRQVSTKVPRLPARRLQYLGNLIADACQSLESASIPTVLIHNDINSGNILYDGSRCVVTDWAEACIGIPFVTIYQLCRQLLRHTMAPPAVIREMFGVYRACWRRCLCESQIMKVLRVLPLLSAVSNLYGRGEWLSSAQGHAAAFDTYARSIARHIDHVSRDACFAPEYSL
jgi:hypothetical protein